MSIKEIIIVGSVALVFILLSFYTKKINPKKMTDTKPKSLRIFSITLGVIVIAGEWIVSPHGHLWPKVILTVLGISLIYNSLNGWLFKSGIEKEGHV